MTAAVPQDTCSRLVEDFSLEMTAKDVAVVGQASAPDGTRINVAYLEHESSQQRIEAIRAAREAGFVPVPHISARRLPSRHALEGFLAVLQAEGASERVFVVGGDPSVPQGPYEDALAVIRSGLLKAYGVREVGIAGYPEGHPTIPESQLWGALEDKAAELARQGLSGSIITQFGFDVDAVVAWIERVRSLGVDLPVRVGVPGPASVGRLLRYAARFGAGTSVGIARKYGFSLTNLLGTAGPGRFLRDLAGLYDPGRQGSVGVHFYTFGGLAATTGWISQFKEGGAA
jgi:methylenetetrahydrofolate reductase (NADPH)